MKRATRTQRPHGMQSPDCPLTRLTLSPLTAILRVIFRKPFSHNAVAFRSVEKSVTDIRGPFPAIGTCCGFPAGDVGE